MSGFFAEHLSGFLEQNPYTKNLTNSLVLGHRQSMFCEDATDHKTEMCPLTGSNSSLTASGISKNKSCDPF